MTKTPRTFTAPTKFIGAALAAGLVALSAPAAARDARVSYGDLDLATAAGRAELDKRIDRAAAEACAAEPLTGSRIRKSSLVRKCVADARKAIDAQVARNAARHKLGG